MQKEKERSGLLETMERKQKSRIGAPKESEEAFFRDTGLGQRDFGDGDEAGKDLWESRWNGERSKPERRMLLEVAFLGRGGIWSLKLSKIGPSGESGVGVNGNGSLGDQRSMSSTGGSQNRRKTAVRKESAESQVYKSCQQNAWSWASPRCGERFGWVARNPSESSACAMSQRGEAKRRRAEEYRAADSAEEHGFREADQRASRRTGMSYIVVHVPSVSLVST